MTDEEKTKKIDELARKIIKISENTIFLNMRFLTKAVTSLVPVPYSGTAATDGRRLYYSPEFILKRYKTGERLPVHDIMHVIMHCVFRHWFIGRGVSALRWDAACDIAAEAMTAELGMLADKRYCVDPNGRYVEKRRILAELGMKIRPLTAEKLYAYFAGLDDGTVSEYADIFRTDDHKMWHKPEQYEYEPEEEQKTLGLGYPDPNGENGDADQNDGDGPSDGDKTDAEKDAPDSESGNGGGKDGDESGNNGDSGGEDGDESGNDGGSGEDGDNTADNGENGGADGFDDAARALSDMQTLQRWRDEARQNALKQLENMWRDIAKQIEMELGHFNKNAGSQSENLVQALEEVNRERYDYTDFLKKFAVMGEAVKPDTESFDRNYYCYGLSLYENIALIEPLEYKEVKKIRDFVIAIDTSGSVSGALVQSFVQKTYNILNTENSFFRQANIYIIQCDTEVREAVKITCRRDFENYIENMEIKGLGGTDFRPVFEYVQTLIKNKEFSNLKGMIYFTDGCGKFPERKPPYDTAFVFMRSDYETSGCPEVPPWAVKVILESGDIG